MIEVQCVLCRTFAVVRLLRGFDGGRMKPSKGVVLARTLPMSSRILALRRVHLLS